METKNFIELPWDEYNNRNYTLDQPYVIKAQLESGRLHVIEPEHIKVNWPTLSVRHWVEVDHPVGPITEAKWLVLVSDSHGGD